MYSLSIHFGPSPMPAQFLFKSRDKVDDAINLALTGAEFSITDEFGQFGFFMKGSVHAVISEDLEAGEEARIQRGLSNARGQAKANERAKADPVLRQAMLQQQKPSMLTPFANGGFNG